MTGKVIITDIEDVKIKDMGRLDNVIYGEIGNVFIVAGITELRR